MQHPSINEKEVNSLLMQTSQLQSIIFISALLYPIWGLLYTQQPEYQDPYGIKVAMCLPLLILNALSYKFQFIHNHLAKIFYFFVFCAVAHLHYFLFKNEMAMDYVIGGLIFHFCIVNIITEAKMRMVFAAIFTVFSFAVFLQTYGLDAFQLSNKAVFYLLGIMTVDTLTVFSYFNYKKIQSAFVAEINENTGLRRWSSVGQMAGGIAHEINTPLTTMSLILSGLEEKLENKDPSAKKDIKILVDTGEKIASIVHSLRLLTVTGGKFERDKISLFDIVFQAKSDFLPRFKEKNIEFAYVYNIESKGLVWGSGAALRHIVTNLLKNAIDAVEHLDERWIKVLLVEDKSHYKILVQNSGPTIDKDIIEKIFEPFFSTKDIGAGMGIGLSITKTLVLAHGGTIRVDTKNPHVMFEVALPKIKEELKKNKLPKAA